MATQTKPRIRIDQQYLAAGVARQPSGEYLNVVSVDPLIVQPEVWTGKRGLDPIAYDADALTALPLLRDPELSADELREALIGRTVVALEVERVKGDFPQGDGDLTLTLDDGRTVTFASWGYDAWGLNAFASPPLSP